MAPLTWGDNGLGHIRIVDPEDTGEGGDVGTGGSPSDADAAAASAVSAQASAAAAGAASGRLDVGNFAGLATGFVYANPSAGQQMVAEGDVILWRAEKVAYQVLGAGDAAPSLDYTASGGVKLLVLDDGGRSVRAYGAGQGNAAQDTAAFQACMDDLIRYNGTYVAPPGSYTLTSQITCNVQDGFDAEVVFEPGAQITSNGGFDTLFSFNNAADNSIGLTAPITRGDITCTVNDGTKAQVGDLIYVQSNRAVVLGFADGASEINRVVAVDGNVLTLEKAFIFDFPLANVAAFGVHRHAALRITGGRLKPNGFGNGSAGCTAISVWGFSDLVIDGVTAEQSHRPSKDNGGNGITMAFCWAPRLRHLNVRQFKYGVAVNCCYAAVVDGIDAHDCRHPVDPNVLAVDTLVRDMTARDCNSAIQDHAAIGTIYDHFRIEQDRGRPLLRGFGGGYRNGWAEYVGEAVFGEHCLPLQPDFAHLRRDFFIENVEEIAPNLTTSAATVGVLNADTVRLKNYKTWAFGPGDHTGVREVLAEDCSWAFLRGGATEKTTLKHVVFDQARNPTPPASCISLNGSSNDGLTPALYLHDVETARDSAYSSFLGTDFAAVETITGASGTGSVATVEFAATTRAFDVGAIVLVQGVTPAEYNGLRIVTAATTTSVSFKSTAAGAFVSGGTVEAYNLRYLERCKIAVTGTNAVYIHTKTPVWTVIDSVIQGRLTVDRSPDPAENLSDTPYWQERGRNVLG